MSEPFEMSGNGVEDASKRRGQFTFESPMTGSMEMVSDDMTLYMRSDLFSRRTRRQGLDEARHEARDVELRARPR